MESSHLESRNAIAVVKDFFFSIQRSGYREGGPLRLRSGNSVACFSGLTYLFSFAYDEDSLQIERGGCNYSGLGVFLEVSVGEQQDAKGFRKIRREARRIGKGSRHALHKDCWFARDLPLLRVFRACAESSGRHWRRRPGLLRPSASLRLWLLRLLPLWLCAVRLLRPRLVR